MPRALLGILDDVGEPAVERPPAARRQRVVRRGGEQRVREAHTLALEHEHAGLERRVEAAVGRRRAATSAPPARRPPRAAPPSRPAAPRAGRDTRRPRSSGTGSSSPGASAPPRRRERPRELEREERVPARALVDAAQRRPRERRRRAARAAAAAIAPRAQAAPPRPAPRPPRGRARAAASSRSAARAAPRRARPARPPERERERGAARRVEPLHVVDRDDQRLAGASRAQHLEHATAIARGSGGAPRASSSSSATDSARRRGAGSAAISPRPARGDRRAPRTPAAPPPRPAAPRAPRNRARRASATANRHSSVFPIPASPSSTSAAGPHRPGRGTPSETQARSRGPQSSSGRPLAPSSRQHRRSGRTGAVVPVLVDSTFRSSACLTLLRNNRVGEGVPLPRCWSSCQRSGPSKHVGFRDFFAVHAAMTFSGMHRAIPGDPHVQEERP